MKILLLMSLGMITVISSATIMHDAFHPAKKQRNLKTDTIPIKTRDIEFKGIRSVGFSIDTANVIWYDVIIDSPKKGRVAYKKRDSAWVILDTAETLKMLLWQMERQSKLYR